MYNNLLEKYQKLEEGLNMTESKNDVLRMNLSKYENQERNYENIQEKYKVFIIFILEVIYVVRS